MEKCGGCSADVFAGQGCISCGHINGTSAPAPSAAPSGKPEQNPLADLMGDAPASGGMGDQWKSLGMRKQIFAVLGVLGLMLVGATALLGSKADTSAESAAADEAETAAVAPDEFATLDRHFCATPAPVADAPEPTSSGANMFATYMFGGPREWVFLDDAPFGQEHMEENASGLGISALKSDQVAAYVACVDAERAGDQTQVCRGYDNGGSYTFESYKFTMSVYQASTGELMHEGAVRSETQQQSCPWVIVGESTYSAFPPRNDDIAMWNVDLAAPGEFTSIHLSRTAGGGSSTWCDDPKAIDGLNPSAAGGYHLIQHYGTKSEAEKLDWQSRDMDQVTHMACVQFASTSKDLVCNYGRNRHIYRKGQFKVTVVDLATADTLGSEIFEYKPGCPKNPFFERDHQRIYKKPTFTNEMYEWLSAMKPADLAGDETADETAEEAAE